MQQIRRILVAVDPGEDNSALMAKAVRLARGLDAAVKVCCCDSVSLPQARRYLDAPSFQRAADNYRNLHTERLERLVEPLRRASVDVTVDVRCEAGWSLADAIARAASDYHADLIMKRAAHVPAIRRRLFSNADWQLIRRCPVPLLLTHDRPWNATTMRVAAALDPGHPSDPDDSVDRELLAALTLLRSKFTAEVLAIHVIPSPDTLFMALDLAATAPAAVNESAREFDQMREQRVACLAAIIRRSGLAGDIARIIDGDPIAVLPKFVAQSGIDIFIVGAKSRGDANRAIIGGTAEKLLDRIDADLLIISPDAKRADASQSAL
ncbi:MAG: universal stress protein [Steroidobacteraceae bacterium]